MGDVKAGRRERRRRKAEIKMEVNESVAAFQKTIENVEFSIKPHVTHSLAKLVRQDTYKVLHSKIPADVIDGDEANDWSGESLRNDSDESKNLTYNLSEDTKESNCGTYNINKAQGENNIRPVPAPRKLKSRHVESEKVSSDTDRDITEIDLDDIRAKSPTLDLKSQQSTNSNKSAKSDADSDRTKNELIMAPMPKPRKSVKNLQESNSVFESLNSVSLRSSNESLNSKNEDEEQRSANSKLRDGSKNDENPAENSKSNQLPLITNLQNETKSDEVKQKSKKQKKLIGELFDLKKKKNKSRKFSSLMKLEKKKIPEISSILKDLKEEEVKEFKTETEEDKIDFQIESPHYTASAENKQIYVQSKNGFRLMERDEVLRNGKQKTENGGNGGMLEDSTVKTAILFQKYWSRSMIYFHGVLAGFGLSHAATITAVMFHYNYEPQGFIGIYSCLSLKIHYTFYTLIALCIISCFDRIDIGHLNRKHWQSAWKFPSMWVILSIYIISFMLTFSNQMMEARFDAHLQVNETELWNSQSQNKIQVSLLQWYHTLWARDMLVLLAWLIISLTKFTDFLHSHIRNMDKYMESQDSEKSIHQIAGHTGDYL